MPAIATSPGSSPAPGLDATPVCVLDISGDRLVTSLIRDGQTEARRTISHVDRSVLSRMSDEHRAALVSGWSPGPYDYWSTATARYLDRVYRLITCPLIELVAPLPRIALRVSDPILAALPIETAHTVGEPALFEMISVYRQRHRGTTSPARRRFVLELCPTDVGGLHAVPSETTLIESAYRARRIAGTPERIVHIAGHDPTVSADRFRAGERAHVVLSGCGGPPPELPPGVASATASLWPIDDQSNVSLMSLFHSKVASGIGPLEALRQAQLLQRALPPLVWASYVHIGLPD